MTAFFIGGSFGILLEEIGAQTFVPSELAKVRTSSWRGKPEKIRKGATVGRIRRSGEFTRHL
jgi:hypothetical protein